MVASDNPTWEVKGTTGYVGFDKKEDGTYGIVSVSSKYIKQRKNKKDGYNDKGFVTYKEGEKTTKNERGKGIKSREPHSKKLKHVTDNNGVKPIKGVEGL